MATLQELERPIDEAIVDRLVEATPEWWKSAVLEVTRTTEANGMVGFTHRITSPEGHRDIVVTTDEIFHLTKQLADLFTRFGGPWKKVSYAIHENPGGGWHYSADFVY